MAIDPGDVSMFVALIAAGNLSAAARALNTSPAAMSRRLAALESVLGVRLVTRTSRHFALTEEGERFHERCASIVAAIANAEAEVTQGVGQPRGHLRIGAPLQWGRRVLAPSVARFRDRYPGVDIHLVLTDANLDVVRDGLDVVIGVAMPNGAEAVVRTIRSGRRVACAAPTYLKARGTPRMPEDLKDHDCIRLVVGDRIFDRWTFRQGDGTRTVQVTGKLATTSTEVVNDWVVAGLGIALRAEWDIAEALRAGSLVPLLEPYACDRIQLHVSYATKRHLPPRIRAFLDFLDAEAEPPEPTA